LAEIICNTSPLQYLHQLGRLSVLAVLAGRISVPQAVVDELAVGRAQGVDLPDPANLNWVSICSPKGQPVLPPGLQLGPGEQEVLALAIESTDAVVVLDDALARRAATALGLRMTGTLGLLIDAKQAGLVTTIEPLLDQLQVLGFRLHPATRRAVLALAAEGP